MVTFHLGSRVFTHPHKCYLNLSWGWCAVTSLDSYDLTKGAPHSLGVQDYSGVPSILYYHASILNCYSLQHSDSRRGEEVVYCPGQFIWFV